jgi:DsbC/DsbD-like thiol-disulfide interchange protein
MFELMKATAFISALLATYALAQQPHATAKWVTSTQNVSKGSSIRSIIKMKISGGWYTYWKNPGEGGIPLNIKAKLPDGWRLDEIQYPAPEPILTGELPSFGYKREVLLPITIHPAHDTQGPLPEIKATLSWLACNESSCVPGEVELTLSTQGDASVIQTAYSSTPQPLDGGKLEFIADKTQVTLILTLPEKSKMNPSTYDIFPVTPDVISAASELRFKAKENKPDTWIATGKSSEYIDVEIKSLAIEMFKSGEASWSISSGK